MKWVGNCHVVEEKTTTNGGNHHGGEEKPNGVVTFLVEISNMDDNKETSRDGKEMRKERCGGREKRKKRKSMKKKMKENTWERKIGWENN